MLHKMKLIEFFDPYLYLTIQDAICDIEKKNPENLELVSNLFKIIHIIFKYLI